MADITTLEVAALAVADSVLVTVVSDFNLYDAHDFVVRVRAR